MDKATFEDIYGVDSPLFKLAWFHKEQAIESDRGRVLVVAAFLEDLLGELLAIHLPDQPSTTELIGGDNAVISAFASKAALACSLGLLSEREFKEISTVRKIRIKFAHFVRVSFQDQSVAALTKNLGFALEKLDANPETRPKGRLRFDFATTALLMELHDRPEKLRRQATK